MPDSAVVGTALEVPLADGHRPPVPAGTRLSPDRSFEWLADTLVAGGSPWRLLRLTDQGAGLVARWLGGDPVSNAPGSGALARRLVDANLLHPWHGRRPLAEGQVDVVVPVRDDATGLEALLRTLGATPCRVVVVDDGSLDPLEVARVAARHGATCVRREVPGGPGAARNTGLGSTSSPLVAFVDVDARPEEDWLEHLVGYFDDPLCALVAPRVRGPVGPGVRNRFEFQASPLDLGTHAGIARPGGAVPFVPAAALLARRTAIGDGFDESLRVGEDVDLCWRLTSRGWIVRYVPDVIAVHPARGSWPQWVAQRFRYGTAAARLEARHGDAAAPLRADPRVLAPLALMLAGRPRAAFGMLSVSGAALSRQLEGIAVRGGHEAAARQVALRGTLLAAPGLARSAFRSYGPVLLVAAAAVAPLRRPVATIGMAATATRWWRAGRPQPAAAFALMSVADDLAYGAGVLAGAVRTRRVGALRPLLRPTSSAPGAAVRRA